MCIPEGRVRLEKRPIKLKHVLPFRSGFVHLFTNRIESLANCLLGSINACKWSIKMSSGKDNTVQNKFTAKIKQGI